MSGVIEIKSFSAIISSRQALLQKESPINWMPSISNKFIINFQSIPLQIFSHCRQLVLGQCRRMFLKKKLSFKTFEINEYQKIKICTLTSSGRGLTFTLSA